MRLLTTLACLVMAVALWASLPVDDAKAATPCPTIEDSQGNEWKVAVWRVGCEIGREIGDRWLHAVDKHGLLRDARLKGWRCRQGAQAFAWCEQGNQAVWVIADPNASVGHLIPHPEPRPYLSRLRAQQLMRHALITSDFGFEAGYKREVRCPTRLSKIRRRCRISWIAGDLYISGRGMVWISPRRGVETWRFSYRLTALNAYCVSAGGTDCRTTTKGKGRRR
jgi:hypothetical protein